MENKYVLTAVLGFFVQALILMEIWNHLFVGLFSLREIDYFESLLIKIFFSLIFGRSPFIIDSIASIKNDLHKLLEK